MRQIRDNSYYSGFAVAHSMIIFLLLALCAIGLVLLYSAAGGSLNPWVKKQFYVLLLFLPLIYVIRYIDTSFIFNSAYYIYFFCLFLLVMAEVLGHYAMGAQRWIRFGMINLQPSEFMKIAMVIMLAHYFHEMHSSQILKLKFLLMPIAMLLLPVFLILKQPNLGTAIITLAIAAGIFFASGVRLVFFAVPIIAAIASLPIIWNLLHAYQKRRIMTFLNPESDLLGAGYNIMQSKIAIGSGGFHGKGLLNGTQNQLSFLPEKHTDFIFTLLAEEAGFMGCMFVLLLYTLLILCCYYIALSTRHQFGRLVVCGIATMLFAHIFVNVGMVSGMLPAVGIPLPFLSYGGSNLGVMLLGFGLVLNIQKHQKHMLNQEI
ncbi:MAG: rod shape-determining protein RodA [Candidatus Lariskella arthropodorum]